MHDPEKEKEYLEKHPKGMRVWVRRYREDEWKLTDSPDWGEDAFFIVDDEWAELRKAQTDCKTIQYRYPNVWISSVLTWEAMQTTRPEEWRIRPKFAFVDKQPIWAWDDPKFPKVLAFWDAKNDTIFSMNGKRNGIGFHFYAPVEKIEPWMMEMQARLED